MLALTLRLFKRTCRYRCAFARSRGSRMLLSSQRIVSILLTACSLLVLSSNCSRTQRQLLPTPSCDALTSPWSNFSNCLRSSERGWNGVFSSGNARGLGWGVASERASLDSAAAAAAELGETGGREGVGERWCAVQVELRRSEGGSDMLLSEQLVWTVV